MSQFYEQAAKQLSTIADYLRWGISQFNAAPLYYGHGTDNSRDEVVALIIAALNLNYPLSAELLSAQLLEEERHLLLALFKQRIENKIPVPYLTNKAWFAGLEFYVDERVLIPRSPLAELIEQQFAPWVAVERVQHILDVGTGSGCIAIACSYAFPQASIDAVDISADALAVAAKNVTKHHCEQQVTLRQSDVFKQLPAETKYDIIVSNPPYVSDAEMLSLPAEYLHEPHIALAAAQQGLEIIDDLLANASRHLQEGGILVVEVGNSDLTLSEKYPEVPFIWLEFERGGDGVFMLTYQQLIDYFK